MVEVLIVLAFLLLLVALAGGGWLLSRWTEKMQVMFLASLPKAHASETTAYSLIREGPALDAKTNLLMWQGIGSSPWWPALQQKFQADARGFIHQSKSDAQEGREFAMAFMAGASWWAQQMAVAPEREVKTAMFLMENERSIAERETAPTNGRKVPGRSWS